MIHSYNKSHQDALFINFILVKNSTCFGQNCCPSSGVLILYSQQLVFVILVTSAGVFHCTHSGCVCHRGLADSLLSATLYDIRHCCVCREKTPDDGQRNCAKHVEFYSKNKFEK